ncbi:MAG: competence protein ComEA helix-hairpin-helix repeat protein [Gemmatimonadetes bacterium]|nr:competence protein ComEA helix-hairpin-helix repeat protein [Gemmatimonadota bacterium]
MAATKQERLALGVLALLLAAGAGARGLRSTPAPAQWAPPDPAAETPAAAQALLARSQAAERADAFAATPLGAGEKVDVNVATEDELRRLPRVSKALAGRIVAWRTQHGPFRTTADLDAVSGVGEGTLSRLAPYLSLPAGPATASTVTSTDAAGAATPPPSSPGTPSAVASTAGGTVDLNRATATELEALPGVGRALAARIVDWRSKNGGFATVEDLAKVPGIGPAKLARLRPLVRTGS